jgi:hypothetical protein
MSQVYTNENFPFPAVEELRRLGHDVLTVSEAGNAGKAVADQEVLAFATAHRRILITLNRRHFVRLHAETPCHEGIIVCSLDADFVALARRIHTELAATPTMAGRLLRVNRPA